VGQLVAAAGEFVQLLARDLELARDQLRRLAHDPAFDVIPQAVPHDGVFQLDVAVLVPGAALHVQKRRVGHALDAARHVQVAIAQPDEARRQHRGFQTAAAHLVDRHAAHVRRQPGAQRDLARHGLPGSGGEHLPDDHFVDPVHIDAAPFHGGADGELAQLGCRERCQRAQQFALGNAGRAQDDGVARRFSISCHSLSVLSKNERLSEPISTHRAVARRSKRAYRGSRACPLLRS